MKITNEVPVTGMKNKNLFGIKYFIFSCSLGIPVDHESFFK